jgi:N-methylhydantoinase B
MTDHDALDPVVFEVVWHRLLDITEEMGIKYMRTSGSPILVGAYDASTGITLPDGRLVAMGPYITTQGHVLRLIIESVLRMRSKNPGVGVGDMFICNDPYQCTSTTSSPRGWVPRVTGSTSAGANLAGST